MEESVKFFLNKIYATELSKHFVFDTLNLIMIKVVMLLRWVLWPLILRWWIHLVNPTFSLFNVRLLERLRRTHNIWWGKQISDERHINTANKNWNDLFFKMLPVVLVYLHPDTKSHVSLEQAHIIKQSSP